MAFGVIALLLTAGFVEWIFWAAREGAIEEGLGHIHIVRPGYLGNGLSDPYKYLMPENSAPIATIEKLPSVRIAAPRIKFNGLISHGETTLSFLSRTGEPTKRARTQPEPVDHRGAI